MKEKYLTKFDKAVLSYKQKENNIDFKIIFDIIYEVMANMLVQTCENNNIDMNEFRTFIRKTIINSLENYDIAYIGNSNFKFFYLRYAQSNIEIFLKTHGLIDNTNFKFGTFDYLIEKMNEADDRIGLDTLARMNNKYNFLSSKQFLKIKEYIQSINLKEDVLDWNEW